MAKVIRAGSSRKFFQCCSLLIATSNDIGASLSHYFSATTTRAQTVMDRRFRSGLIGSSRPTPLRRPHAPRGTLGTNHALKRSQPLECNPTAFGSLPRRLKRSFISVEMLCFCMHPRVPNSQPGLALALRCLGQYQKPNISVFTGRRGIVRCSLS